MYADGTGIAGPVPCSWGEQPPSEAGKLTFSLYICLSFSYINGMLQLTILSRAVKQLSKISRRDAQVILEKLEQYASDRNAAVDVKPLKGQKGVFRLRHGNWRAIFEIDVDRQTMIVVDVFNRRDAYR